MKVLGFVLSFLGTSTQSVGLILQKKAQNEGLREDKKSTAVTSGIWDESDADGDDEDKKGEKSETPEKDNADDLDLPPVVASSSTAYLKSGLWRLGFALHTSGSIMGFFSISMIGPGMFIIISTFGLLFNLLLSPCILQETSYKSDWLAVFFIAAGISLCIVAIETSERKTLDVQASADLISRPIAAVVWGSLAGLIVGLTYACRLKAGTIEPETSAQRFAFIVRAAVSATLQVLLSTPSSLLLTDPENAPGFLWVVLSAMVANVVLDVHFQNRSLRFNDILTHGPIVFVM